MYQTSSDTNGTPFETCSLKMRDKVAQFHNQVMSRFTLKLGIIFVGLLPYLRSKVEHFFGETLLFSIVSYTFNELYLLWFHGDLLLIFCENRDQHEYHISEKLCIMSGCERKFVDLFNNVLYRSSYSVFLYMVSKGF